MLKRQILLKFNNLKNTAVSKPYIAIQDRRQVGMDCTVKEIIPEVQHCSQCLGSYELVIN